MLKSDPSLPYDAVIIGGSYAGLSAAMTLGRSLRRTLVLDDGKPANRFTPQAHNLVTRDGVAPEVLAKAAREQVSVYEDVDLVDERATAVTGADGNFEVETASGRRFRTRKVLLATGLRDLLPDKPGFLECWGHTLIHCPYCHGYEVRGLATGIIQNGEKTLDYVRLILNLTDEVTVFTQGTPVFDVAAVKALGVGVVEMPIEALLHEGGVLSAVQLASGEQRHIRAMYYAPPFELASDIAVALDCALTEMGHIQVNIQATTVPGIYAAGDCATPMRALSVAMGQGNVAGAMMNHALCAEK